MSRKYRLLEEAERELYEAVEFYDGRQFGLGQDLAEAVHAAIGRIVAAPDTFPFIEDEYRYIQTKRFPYLLIYRIDDDGTVVIVAVMHASRRPSYWKDRVEDS